VSQEEGRGVNTENPLLKRNKGAKRGGTPSVKEKKEHIVGSSAKL